MNVRFRPLADIHGHKHSGRMTMLAAAMLMLSTSPAQPATELVSVAEYNSAPRCWFVGGHLEAFVVVPDVARGRSGYPWFISARCMAKGDLPSFGAAALSVLVSPRISDPRRLLRTQVSRSLADGNLETDLPLPGSNSDVLLVSIQVRRMRGLLRGYEILRIDRTVATGVRFERFLGMGPAARDALRRKIW